MGVSSEFENYIGLVRDGLDSWKQTVAHLQSVGVVWDEVHPAIAISLVDLDAGLNNAYELAGSSDRDLARAQQAMLMLSPRFASLITALTALRDNSNAIKDFFNVARKSEQGVTKLDENRLNNADGQQLDLATYLTQIKSNAGVFINELASLDGILLDGNVADLSDRIRAFSDLADQLRPIADDIKKIQKAARGFLGQIKSASSESASLLSSIQDTKSKADVVSAEADKAANEINAKLAAIRETAKQAETLQQQVESYQAKFDALDEEIDNRLASLRDIEEQNLAAKTENEEREAEIDRISEESNQMLKGAVNAGLATAFNNAAKKYGDDAETARTAFYWAIGILLLTAIPLTMYVLPLPAIPLIGFPGDGATDIKFGGVIARAILLVPGVWLTTFAGHRYWSLFQLHRVYSFKSAIAMSVEGFKAQAPEYEQEIAGATFVELSEKPDYNATNDSNKNPNPIMGYLIHMLEKRFAKLSGE
jgi:hypothetical protein